MNWLLGWLAPANTRGTGRTVMLDGWRASSILLVLAGHWLPLGPSAWGMNEAAAASGMAIFFSLSGYLITTMLLEDQRIGRFLLRRLFRIVPLAWVATTILVVAQHAGSQAALANFFFYANLPPARLLEGGHHFWSLCVEVQFYLSVALLVLIAGRRGLFLLPVVMIAITALRMVDGEYISIVTWHRVDEILIGATIALAMTHEGCRRSLSRLPRWTPVAAFVLLLLCAQQTHGFLGYFRPYVTGIAVASSLFVAPRWLEILFSSRAAAYVARLSYAVYVIHGMLTDTWLGSGETIERYLKRPLLIGCTFLLAHLSTTRFEEPITDYGRKLSNRLYPKRRVTAAE